MKNQLRRFLLGPLVFVLAFLSLTSIRCWCQETVLHQFSGPDGAKPHAGLISDTAGNLYGTTSAGGLYNAGTVFELVYTGGGYSETILHSFTGGNDGGSPLSSLAMDAAGNLYGSAETGGTGSCSSTGCGVVFELVKSTGYSETILHRFTGGADGGLPYASLTFDASGNLYGTVMCGGSTVCSGGTRYGVVFMLVKASGYAEAVLHRFSGGADGGVPVAPVILDASGNVYGTTEAGGTGSCSASGCGVVFELVKSSSFAETVLHRFTGGADGGEPFAGVIADASGNLYGTTTCGGSGSCTGGSGGDGVLFEIVKSTAALVPLHTFTGPDGAKSTASLVFDNTGTILFGTAASGGAYGDGTAFQFSISANTYTKLLDFNGSAGGAIPISPLEYFQHRVGCVGRCVLGTTFFGGIDDLGLVYQLNLVE